LQELQPACTCRSTPLICSTDANTPTFPAWVVIRFCGTSGRRTSDYHPWVEAEGLRSKFAPVTQCNTTIEIKHGDKIIYSGIGLHDSSAALIPYLATRWDEFCLISTGTWCITLNPFNHQPLTSSELAQDCLCYLSFLGYPVKAARLFSGHFHDAQVKEIVRVFNPPGGEAFYKTISMASVARHIGKHPMRNIHLAFEVFDPGQFADCEAAYLYLIEELVARQVRSTRLVLGSVKDVFVDGGFSANPIFMKLLARALPDRIVSAATVTQASSLGAAIAIHDAWNKNQINPGILKLKAVDPE
jgi:sugar (pentulose or hexulose) kinase